MTVDRQSITLKVQEVNYLLLNMSTLVNQLVRYRMAENEVIEYAQSSAGFTAIVPPRETASLFVQYDVLFEEITGKL